MNATTTPSAATVGAVVGVLSRRDLALLRATAAGRCELLCGTHPDLLIDGRWCCDQSAAHALAAGGLLTPTVAAPPGVRVPAELTDTGRAALTENLLEVAAGTTVPDDPAAPRTSTRTGGHPAKNTHRAGFPNTHEE